MTFAGAFALAVLMSLLAAIPSSSVVLVVVRSSTYGTKNGLAASAGVVAGDLIFMTLALLGMTALAEQIGTVFILVKYAAAAYLIWFGIHLMRSQLPKLTPAPVPQQNQRGENTLLKSFGSGLLLTLGDAKAIFFYASVLPMFLDLTALTAIEIGAVSAITMISVGSVKSCYAIGGRKLAQFAEGFACQRKLKIASGSFMVAAGAYIFADTRQ